MTPGEATDRDQQPRSKVAGRRFDQERHVPRRPQGSGWGKRFLTALQALPGPTPQDAAEELPEPHDPAPEVAAALVALGAAMLEAGQSTYDVESTLLQVGAAYHCPDAKVIVLPTVIMVNVPGPKSATTEVGSVSGQSLRLDQAGRTADLVAQACAAEVDPGDVLTRVAEIRTAPPRFGPFLTVVGHTVLTLGFGLTLNPTWAALPAYGVLGAAVGVLIVVGRRLPTLSTILPVVAAFLVTALTALFLAAAVGEEPLRILTPPLVTFLPGLLLTIAAVELTSNQIIAGASRIVYGIAQLALLAFGVFAALTLVGPVHPHLTPRILGGWSPWVGVLLTAVGYVLFSSAPKWSFPWILLSLYAAFIGQILGSWLLSPELSGFVGALVVFPVTRLISRFRSAPPGIVMMLPSFWLLVPGALGFIGFGQAATDAPGGTTQLVNTAISLAAIAIGMLVGTGMTRDVGVVKNAWRSAPTR